MVPILASGLTEGSRVEKGLSEDGKAQEQLWQDLPFCRVLPVLT